MTNRLSLILAVLFLFSALFFNANVALAHTPSPQTCDAGICNIDVRDNFFQPASISIRPPDPLNGETVTLVWQNHGFLTHTVTSGVSGVPDGIFDRTLLSGQTFQLVIDESVYSQILSKYPDGVVPYYCRLHSGMTATLIIRTTTPEPKILQVSLQLSQVEVDSEETVTITVTVVNGSSPIEGALVQLASDKGGVFSVQSGLTGPDGKLTSVFTAPNVAEQTNVTLTAAASMASFAEGSDQVGLLVHLNSQPPPQPQATPDLWIYLAAVVVASVVFVTTIVLVRRRSGNQRPTE